MFNDWLLSQLQERDMSQAGLARASGLTTGAISNYINGRVPTQAALRKIAKALKLPPENVFRAAGILPPETELSPIRRQLLHLTENLPDADLQMVIAMLEQRDEHYRQNPNLKPKTP